MDVDVASDKTADAEFKTIKKYAHHKLCILKASADRHSKTSAESHHPFLS